MSSSVRYPFARPKRKASCLRVSSLTVQYAGVIALQELNLQIGRDGVVGIIGPNGAGKTTLINVLSGFTRPTNGQIFVDDHPTQGWGPRKLVQAGIVRTFQSGRLFGRLTALDNVRVAAIGSGKRDAAADILAAKILEATGLASKRGMVASALSQGDERRLSLARALATQPSILLLDEPGAGLNETETDALLATLRRVHYEAHVGLVVVEHDMRLITGLCDRIVVLDDGRLIADGTPEEIRHSQPVLTAYLGSG